MTRKNEERKAKGDARVTVAATESAWKRRPDMCPGSGVYARGCSGGEGGRAMEAWMNGLRSGRGREKELQLRS